MKAYYIPNGPKDLATLFPLVDFDDVQSYYIEVESGGNVIATGTVNELDGECCTDKVRLRFLNYLGAIDAINFKKVIDEHEAKSDRKQVSTTYPLVKSKHTVGRFNVTANNFLTLSTHDYREEDMGWINELIDSPLAWIEWDGIQSQADDFIPVVVLDMKAENVKKDDRYVYEITLVVEMSNQKFIIRN